MDQREKRSSDSKLDREDTPTVTSSPAARLSLSDRFQASDADMEIRSSDQVRFLVHKSNLAGASETFAQIFSSSQGDGISSFSGLSLLSLDELSNVVEKVLEYCYPKRVKRWKLDFPQDLVYAQAFDKYELWRGIEAIETAFYETVSQNRTSGGTILPLHSLEHYVYASAFSAHFDLPELHVRVFPYLLDAVAATPKGITLIQQIDVSFMSEKSDMPALAGKVAKYLYSLSEIRDDLLFKLSSKIARHAESGCSMVELFQSWNEVRSHATPATIQKNSTLLCRPCKVALHSTIDELVERVRVEVEGQYESSLKSSP